MATCDIWDSEEKEIVESSIRNFINMILSKMINWKLTSSRFIMVRSFDKVYRLIENLLEYTYDFTPYKSLLTKPKVSIAHRLDGTRPRISELNSSDSVNVSIKSRNQYDGNILGLSVSIGLDGTVKYDNKR